jgi:tetratricopeptide (TPR) repeat protein
MKKTVILILIVLTVQTVFSQDTAYYSVLRKGINVSNQGYSSENFLELANTCERIIAVKPGQWLPHYYCAYAYINMSFIEKNTDTKNAYCEKAKTLIEKAFTINPSESELNVLEALLCYAVMEINPMVNGLIYLPKANKALEIAKTINPGNPRIYYLNGKSTMYMPEFLGGGKKAAYPILKQALELYNKFIPETNLHPDWGKGSTVELLYECKKENE